MEYLISAFYTIIDCACVLIFFGIFATPRFWGLKFKVVAAFYIIFCYLIIVLNMSVFQYNVTVKSLLILFGAIVFGSVMYTNISMIYICLLAILEYVVTYCLSFAVGSLSALVCGVNVMEFRQKEIPFIVSSLLYYFLEIMLTLTASKVMSQRSNLKNNLKQNSPQIMLYLAFPIASFSMLLILLRISSGQPLGQKLIIGCCLIIFAANLTIIFLLEQIEQARQNSKQLLALDQQIQLQSKNMEATCNLYSTQRKQVHDFRAHINILNQLLGSNEYDEAKKYLEGLLKAQSTRIFLVSCNHPVLDALFNTKASEALNKNIDIHFEVNDLSDLPFDSIDLTVLLSNLIDNAIERCEKDSGERVIQIQALKNNVFRFIIRNTSPPINIVNNEIPSTKPNPQCHGYGLPNIKTIITKYHGEYAMSYKDGYFQFIFEIPISRHS